MVPVPIPYAMQYSATVRGQAPKLTQCEKCGHEYVYFLSRRASGEGTSILFADNKGARERAHERAAERLAAKLDNACDPVPCPACGWLQRDMIARMCHKRYGWMDIPLYVLYPLAAILLVIVIWALTAAPDEDRNGEYQSFLIAVCSLFGIIALSAVGLSVLCFKLRKHFDPNAEDVEKRKERGRSRALSKKDFFKQFPEYEIAENEEAKGEKN